MVTRQRITSQLGIELLAESEPRFKKSLYKALDLGPLAPPHTTTSMPQLPTEMLDCITDYLHDNPDALKACCIVSKSWVRCTRRHLFKCVDFKCSKGFGRWKTNFPDPVNSPAFHARSLFFHHADKLTDADVSWIQSFTSLVRLEVGTHKGPNYNGRPFFPLPRPLINPQVSKHGLDRPSITGNFRLDLFLPLPGGPACCRRRSNSK